MRPFHPEYIFKFIPEIILYLPITLGIMLATVIFGGMLGAVLAYTHLRGKLSAVIAKAYIYISRCIPSIVILFIVYYGLPKLFLLIAIDINEAPRVIFVIIAFSLIFASPMAEVFRTAYLAIDKNQAEAALSVGMTETEAFIHIVLPQSLAVALPGFNNALLSLMKEGALAYTIGFIDIMGKGQLIIGLNQGAYSLETYMALSLIYWGLTIVIERVFGYVEVRLTRQRRALREGKGVHYGA